MRAIAIVVIAGCGRLDFTPVATADAYMPPDVVAQPGCGAVSVALGERHTCVLVENGAAYCTGENTFGELGLGTITGNVDTPVVASRLAGATSLYAGRGFTAFVDMTGAVSCIGSNGNRQCGVPSGATLDPVNPVGLPAVTGLSTGDSFSCATTMAGDLYCWGDGDEGQSGNGTDPGSHLPETVPSLMGMNAVPSAGASHACVTIGAGEVRCWADGRDGRLGGTATDTCANASSGSIECALVPVVVGVPAMQTVRAGEEHTCALTTSGEVWCWGSNDQAQVGLAKSPQEPPAQIGSFSNVAQIVTTHDNTCVLDDGVVHCWGDNIFIQLGRTGSDSATPIVIALPERATGLHAGPSSYHACATLQSGTVWCWGRGDAGQLGRGPQTGGGLPSPMLLPCP